MASSNRHWPSMFKSKPCNPHHLPWQPSDMNPSSLISSSTTSHRTTFPSSSTTSGCEERSPEPKPRWNPKPEQIRILEAIFNSGMVNPPRNEIRKIRAQLEEFGQVGDANVFYWFQNRKSRSKHKLRNSNNIQNSNNKITNKSPPPAPTSLSPTTTNTTITQFSPSNSSSSDNIVKISSPNSSSSSKEMINLLPPAFSNINGFSSDIIHLPTSPTFGGNSVANPTTYFHNETSLNNSEAFFFPASSPSSTTSSHQGFCFSEFSGLVQHQNVGPCTSLLLSEMMNNQKKQDHHTNKDLKSTIMNYPHHHLSFCVTASSSSSSVTPTTVLPTSMVPATTTTTTSVTVPSLVPQIQGEESSGTSAKSIVYINDVAFEVSVGPFNVRAAFGENAVLIHAATGHPVLTNEWGVTLQSLHHGAFYYLI